MIIVIFKNCLDDKNYIMKVIKMNYVCLRANNYACQVELPCRLLSDIVQLGRVSYVVVVVGCMLICSIKKLGCMLIYTIESFILICICWGLIALECLSFTCWGLIALERFIVHLLGAYCPGML